MASKTPPDLDFLRFGSHLGAILGSKIGKVSAFGVVLEPWGFQVGVQEAILAVSWASWDRFSRLWGALGDHFGSIWVHRLHNKKPLKTLGFLRFLEILGVLLEVMLAHLGAMLGYVGPARRHFRATWRQDEAQERQDEPR